ncbi:MAG TPA: ribonuclease III [Candidatus Sulfopaludibacter sp.]|nr:ribonuclease III [Candidatus Sulfopaludibacter sp.]
MRAELASLELRLSHRFADPALLHRALTHSSLANESRPGSETSRDNEQLEFLGDSVLGFLISEALLQRHPESAEGELSRRKAHLVSAAHLHGVSRRLDLGSYLELGRSEEMSGGRAKKTLLVDALEAVIAAIYLDGGMDATRAFVFAHILDAPIAADEDAGTDIQPAITNFKSALQELAQSLKLPQPRYSIVREKGPEHSKIFTVEVRVGKEWTGQAEGRTKKIAAQRAARGVYERLRQPTGPTADNTEPPAGDAAPAPHSADALSANAPSPAPARTDAPIPEGAVPPQ